MSGIIEANDINKWHAEGKEHMRLLFCVCLIKEQFYSPQGTTRMHETY